MSSKPLLTFIFTTILFAIGCKEAPKNEANEVPDQPLNFEEEKNAILETINNETKAAFQRDYESWEEKWVHNPAIVKTYINFADSSFSESVGWEEISGFVRTFIEEHPERNPCRH